MRSLILENDYIKLRCSNSNLKSYVSFDVINKEKNEISYRLCTTNENFIDGVCNLEIEIISNEDKTLLDAIKLFIDYVFYSIPIHKIEYITLEENIKTIKLLGLIGFKIEANLKNDSYLNGKYQDKIILGLLKE